MELRITDTIETDQEIIHLGTDVTDNGDGTVSMLRLAVIANGKRRTHLPTPIKVRKAQILAMTKG